MFLENDLSQDFSALISPFVSNVYTDVLGNVIAHKQGVGERIMLVAHHDVVRLMITYIDANGFLYVKPSGAIDVSILPARKVVIRHGCETVIGILGRRPIHLLREEQSCRVSYDNLWVDIGVKDRMEALSKVCLGDYAYFYPNYDDLSNDLAVGSYFDNRVGVNVLLKLAEQIYETTLPWDIYFVASNHEEIGMRGACVVAHAICPAICICIDTTHATDYPTMNVVADGDIKLGEGCVLAKGPNICPELFECLNDIAIAYDVMCQIEASPYPTGTDANVIQLSRKGVKTAVVSVPCRYMHTPYEICSKKDIESVSKLIGKFLYLKTCV